MHRQRTIALIGLAMMALGAASAYANDMLGLWKIIDDKTNKPTAYILVYQNGNAFYGRMMATIDENSGLIKDTILTRKDKADALAGDPPFCGLDFVYDMKASGRELKGFIIDPKDGKEYACTIRREGDRLTVRGSLKGTGGLLGRNQTWLLASASEIARDFVLPNPASFTPVKPKKK